MGYFIVFTLLAIIFVVLCKDISNYDLSTLCGVLGAIFTIVAFCFLVVAVTVTASQESFVEAEQRTRDDYITILESDRFYDRDDAINVIVDIQQWNKDLVYRNAKINSFMSKGLYHDTTSIEPINLSDYICANNEE